MDASEVEQAVHHRVLQELQDEVWQPLVPSEASEPKDTYYIKYRFTSSSYTLVITNLYHLWFQTCERDEIKKAKLEYNPLLDTPMQRILLMLKQYLIDAAIEKAEEKAQSIQSRMELQDKNLLLHFATKIEFYCFKWTFVCTMMKDDDVKLLFLKQSFVQPLLVIAKEFRQQIEELQSIIAQKDVEIQEYKARGGKLPKGMQAPSFDPKDFVDRRLGSRMFIEALGQPKFSFDGIASAIYSRVIQHQYPPGTSNTTQSQSEGSSQHYSASLQQDSESIASQFSSPPSSPPQPCDYEVNTLNYMESPDEVKRRLAIRKRLEMQKQKKADKDKAVKKRRFV